MTVKRLPHLVAEDRDLRGAFSKARSREDVASLLEISLPLLRSILFGSKQRVQYTETKIPKKHGGTRRICVPPKNLKILQDKLLRILTLVYEPRRCVTGFTKGRSTLDNARQHTGKKIVVSFDLQDFFPSIHIGRVIGALEAGPFSLGREAAVTIGQIATHADGHLPQGAPTSPILANIVCGPLDTALMNLAKRYRFRYTRYADDLTLSTTRRRLPEEIASIDETKKVVLGQELRSTVEKCGFSIRDGKSRVRYSRRRQLATGLVLNEFVNVPQKFTRELRSLIYVCKTKGLPEAATTYAEYSGRNAGENAVSWIENVVRGKLAYVRMIRGEHDPVFRRLLRDASKIPNVDFGSEVPLSEQPSQPLRRRTRMNVNWDLWASRYEHCVFQVQCKEPKGETSGHGTAFRVGPSCFVTAGHNAVVDGTEGGNPIKRTMELVLPSSKPVPLGHVLSPVKPDGVDIALGAGLLPPDWGDTIVPTQERLPRIGEEVAALGYPYVASRHPGLVLHVGRVESVLHTYNRKLRYITVSFDCGPGLSGSPLLDANGYCVGVIVESVAVKTSDAKGYPQRPYGQALAIGHWREVRGCGDRLTAAITEAV